MAFTSDFNIRSGAAFNKDGVDNNDGDYVELDKSNVLLMGPTGSGRPVIFWFS